MVFYCFEETLLKGTENRIQGLEFEEEKEGISFSFNGEKETEKKQLGIWSKLRYFHNTKSVEIGKNWNLYVNLWSFNIGQ